MLLLVFGNVNASQQLYSGDVVLIPLEDTEINREFFYNNNKITTVIENNKPYLLFGIPYESSVGTNSFVFISQTYKKVVKLNIEQKEFGSQNIKINKYKKKSQKQLDRIYSERKEIIEAKKIKYKHYPDINFIIPVEGIVTGIYGTQRYYNGEKGNYHNGHDIAADTGTIIYSPSSGKIILTGDYYYNGKFVMIGNLLAEKQGAYVIWEDKYFFTTTDFAWIFDKVTSRLSSAVLSVGLGTEDLSKIPKPMTCMQKIFYY